MGNDEEEDNVQAEQSSKLPWGRIDRPPVGEQNDCGGSEHEVTRPRCVSVKACTNESIASSFESGGGKQNQDSGDAAHFIRVKD